MKKAPVLANDNERIGSLNTYRILDTEPETEFDNITALAAQITDCPISLISLIDGNRQWFKSRHGLDATETPRDISYCGHAIAQEDIFIVEDATKDERFQDNPLCTGAPNVVFYAGVPLVSKSGHRIGTLCVIDEKPKTLDQKAQELLKKLALQVVSLMDLRLEKLKYKEVSQAGTIGHWFFDLASETIVWSDVMFEIFELDVKEGEPDFEKFQSLIHPDSREDLQQKIGLAVSEGIPYKIQHKILPDSGKEKWVEGIGDPVRDINGNVIALNGVCQDITDKKKKEKDLEDSNTYLQLAMEGGELGIWDWFIDEDRVIFDEGWAKILGLDFNTMKMDFSTWQERVHPDDLPRCFEDINNYLEGKTDTYDNIHRMKHVDGHWIYAQGKAKISARDKNGKPTRLTGTQLDITQFKKQELELNEINQKMQRTEETAKIGSWSIDLETNDIWLSDETYRIYGLEVGSAFDIEAGISFYHPDDRPRITKYVEEAIANGTPYSDEFRFITAKGEHIWIHTAGMFFEDKENGIKRLEGSFQDITEQKQSEIAKDEFLSVISHEMRTPLTSILGLSEVLTEHELDAEASDLVKTINNAGHTVLSLVNDVLDFSKLRSDKLVLAPHEGYLKGSLEDTVRIIELSAIEKGIELKTNIELKNPWVECDFLKLRQVLLNILSNAVKFTDQGEVSFQAVEKEEGTYEFVIMDTGCGMSEEFLPKIFNVFEQDHNSKRIHAGTGLGMTISQQLIQLMGGEIIVSSQLGEGSEFRFTLNLEKAKNIQDLKANRESITQNEGLLEGLVMAYADDSIMNQKVVVKMLAETKVELKSFSNGKELAEFVKAGNHLDFILMDIQMPIMNGLETTEFIREYEKENNLSKIPIVAFSAFAFEKDVEETRRAGCNDHIAKPVKKVDLLQKIKYWTSVKNVG